jgi:dephospho-CoA kinase
MLKIGLTGGIASGKSLVADEFARLGVPVVDADALAHELTHPGASGLAALTAALGTGILGPRGQLDRKRLRAQVFADPGLRRRVDGLLHPLILRELKTHLAAAPGPYALAVIPLLVEIPASRSLVDRVLLVDCSADTQLARLMSRDGESAESARAILSAQASGDARRRAADDILLNENDADTLPGSVSRLHEFYLELAAEGDVHRAGLQLP